MRNKSVLVVMSTYNGEFFLRDQIDSILNQEGDFDIHILVRDDGSSDQTCNILDEYKRNGKLDWYSGENLGPAKSFLETLKNCKAYDYYSFADQDDVWFPQKIAMGLDYIRNSNQPTLFFSNALLVDKQLRSDGTCVYKKSPCTDFYTLSCAGGLLGCTMIFNHLLAQVVKEHPLPDSIIMHDFFMAELCLLCNGKILYCDAPSMYYRQHGLNVVGVKKDFFGKVKGMLKTICQVPKVSIAEHSASLLKYAENKDQIFWLKKVAVYKKNFTSRLLLALSLKTKYASLSKSVSLRTSIFFGHR